MARAMAEDDMYDNYDQAPNESESRPEKEPKGYESFLAPKSAFPSLEVGQIHKVKVDAIHENEVEMHCVEGEPEEEAGESKSEEAQEMKEGSEPDEMYE